MSRFKLVFYAPVNATQTILSHLFSRHPDTVGKIGQYNGCAFIARGTGQFLPQDGATPAIGKVGEQEFVEEDKVEVVVKDNTGDDRSELKKVVEQLKKIHPYEEPAYEVYRLEDI